jgi:ubiquinone/menaquinone biosynthesis C-methylase UbiE
MSRVSRVSFDVAADSYDAFMGRYSSLLAPQLADLAGIGPGQRVLDVGCGPGALTKVLVERLGPESVAAVDPSEQFVAAARERHPRVDVQRASAEELPFADDRFDAAIAQLVVHFMADPVRGLSEMARVTREGGVVAACVWDHAGEQTPLAPFWATARELDPEAADESGLPGGREGHLGELFEQAGLREIEQTVLHVQVEHESFDEWWEPFTMGVGPAGSYLQTLDPARQVELRERVRRELDLTPFSFATRAWAARGLV